MSYNIDLSKDREENKSTISDHEYQREEEEIPPSYQFRALVRKNASLQVNLTLFCISFFVIN